MSKPIVLYPVPGVKLLKNVMIPMRDGVRLAADLYMPDGAAPRVHPARGWDKFSVVMEYIPYRKDEVNPQRAEFYTFLPQHGYVVARVDIRGTGGSEGVNVDEYTLQEQQDGYDAIEWLAAQEWCDGKVNMMGASYGGFTSLQVASHQPPHLTSIIPVYFTDDRYTDDCHYRGGLLRLYYDIGFYGNFMNVRNSLPSYPEWSGADWAKIWEQHLAANEPYYLKWLVHQTDGPYWRPGSVRDFPERIQCPVFMIGGWRDGYPNPPLRLYQALSVPRKVLIGPWNHTMPNAAIPGPRIDYLPEVVRWLDYWCKGVQNGVMDEPPVVVYEQHYQEPVVDRLDTVGVWRAEMSYPPPGAVEKILHLGESHQLLDQPRPEGTREGQDEFAYHPTVGVTAGLWSGGVPFGLPGDQRLDEAFSLVYTTPPLDEDVTILGWPHAVLHVSSTATVIGFAASLSDVAPDGASHLVAKGMLNGTRRQSFTNPEPLTPGEIYELDIEIDCVCWKFSKGHCIRLSIANADWPNVWPTPEPALSHIYHGSDYRSRLILPVVPALGSAAPPQFKPSRTTVSLHSDAPRPPTWQVNTDLLSGQVTFSMALAGEARVNDSTVVRRENTISCHVDPRNPAQASAQGRGVHTIVRPNTVIEGSSDLLVQATRTHFHVAIDVNIRINDAAHFSKRWVESIERQLL
jgi:putative CocE/NonD family hydrolase